MLNRVNNLLNEKPDELFGKTDSTLKSDEVESLTDSLIDGLYE